LQAIEDISLPAEGVSKRGWGEAQPQHIRIPRHARMLPAPLRPQTFCDWSGGHSRAAPHDIHAGEQRLDSGSILPANPSVVRIQLGFDAAKKLHAKVAKLLNL
jgi:hypothetical protein